MRYAQARFEALVSIGQLAVSEGAAFVIVAGDVFEANRVRPRTVVRAMEALAAIPVPVYLLPGSHDPLDAASVYRSPTFARSKPSHVTAAPVRCHSPLRRHPARPAGRAGVAGACDRLRGGPQRTRARRARERACGGVRAGVRYPRGRIVGCAYGRRDGLVRNDPGGDHPLGRGPAGRAGGATAAVGPTRSPRATFALGSVDVPRLTRAHGTRGDGCPAQERSCRVRISAPSAVMAMVCSVWAVRQPVALRSVQPSASMTSSSVSAMIHGSSARSTPGRSS